jgi:hypothetical protein
MERAAIWHAVESAVKKSKGQWPEHVVAQSARVSTAAGELNKSADIYKYQPSKTARDIQTQFVERAAVQVIGQAIRFLENLK